MKVRLGREFLLLNEIHLGRELTFFGSFAGFVAHDA